MKIIHLKNGMLDSNTFIVGIGSECAVIDTGVEPNRIIDAAVGMDIRYIILTHGHVDHIFHTEALRNLTGAEVCIHRVDSDGLINGRSNLSHLMQIKVEGKPADRFLEDKDELKLGELSLKIINTPGHTPGGICIYVNGHLFTGDTIFRGAFGRTDFPKGCDQDLYNSISSILEAYPDETIIHSGHGPDTTVGIEKQINPYKEFLQHD